MMSATGIIVIVVVVVVIVFVAACNLILIYVFLSIFKRMKCFRTKVKIKERYVTAAIYMYIYTDIL